MYFSAHTICVPAVSSSRHAWAAVPARHAKGARPAQREDQISHRSLAEPPRADTWHACSPLLADDPKGANFRRVNPVADPAVANPAGPDSWDSGVPFAAVSANVAYLSTRRVRRLDD